MKIGEVQLQGNLILAPMAGYTDAGFRGLAADYGASLTVTEMVSAKGLCYNNSGTEALLKKSPHESIVAVQIFGCEEEFITRAVSHEALKPFEIIDINMGCPVNKVVKNGEGSALMRDPDRAYAVLRAAVTAALGRPVTVKIRAGFSAADINAPVIAAAAEAAGCAAVTVHGRTREQMYSGRADWEVIGRVKKAVKIPVIGNGDVASREDYLKMLEVTGCDGVMVGRAALGRPYIFAEINDKPYEFNAKSAILRHLAEMLTCTPERVAANVMKSQLCFYAKNTGRAKAVRQAACAAKSLDDIYRVINENF